MKKLHCSYIAQSCKDNAAMNGKQIFIIGGVDESKSIEVFDWSTKTWTLMENFLFFSAVRSFSFLYGKRIMVCCGKSDGNVFDESKRIEFFDPSENGFTSTALPRELPSTNFINGVLVENRIITFGCDVQETSLECPWTSTVLIEGHSHEDFNSRGLCALERIGRDQVEKYYTAIKKLRTLASLPYKVSNMATVAYRDNIIILGGKSYTGYILHDASEFHPLNDVVMFNIYSLECKRLPSMLQKRSGCAAVIMGDVVVVMGG
jgi:hypothetical protein